MTSQFNRQVTISSNNDSLTFEIYCAVMRYLEGKYGKQAIVLSGINSKPSKNGLWFANIYLYLMEETRNDRGS